MIRARILLSYLLALTMLLASVSAVSADNTEIYFSVDFNDASVPSQITTANATWAGVTEPGCGKFSGDKAYQLTAKNARYSEVSFSFDFYKGVDTLCGEGSIREKTLEFSFLYSNIGDCPLILHGDISRNKSTHGWAGSYDYFKVQSGKVYAISGNNDAQETVDTGISVEANKWYRVALEYYENSNGRNVNVYFNGTPIVEGFNTGGNTVYDRSTVLRLNSSSTSVARNIFIDDVAVYQGLYDKDVEAPQYSSDEVFDGEITVPEGTTASEVTSKITSDGSSYVIKQLTGVAQSVTGEVADGNMVIVTSINGKSLEYIKINVKKEEIPDFLKNKTALQPYANKIFYSGQKHDTSYNSIISDDGVLISKPDFETLFNTSVSVSGNDIFVGQNMKMSVNSTAYTYNGTSGNLSVAPIIKDGVLYLPFEEYGSYTDGYVSDSHGLAVVGSDSATYQELKSANRYMFFDRDSSAELKAKFLKNTNLGQTHPRIIADKADFTRLNSERRTDANKKQWYSNVLYTANSIIDEDPVTYTIKDGRLLDSANSALLRLEYLGFAYQMTKQEKYAQRGIAELEAICAFPDWNPSHYLDTGTLASAFAIGFDWLYDAMSEEQRTTLANSAKEKALDTAILAYEGNATFNSFWTDTETNWGVIVNGGIANLALATGEYNTDTAMRALSYALKSIESTWYRFAPDGAWFEGPGYWSYNLTHLSLFMASYEKVMGTPFGKDFMGLSKYAEFKAHFEGPDGLPNNFHDSTDAHVENYGQFYLAKIYNNPSLMISRIAEMSKYNIRPNVMDIIWCDAGLSGDLEQLDLETDKYFRETEFVSMRSGWDADATWVSFHGGTSKDAHDHIDPGTFVYTAGGVRWAIDLGQEPLSYVGSADNPAIQAGYNSYYFYRRKGEGHNIVVINPNDKLEIDQYAFVQAKKPVTNGKTSISSVDLSGAYAKNVNSYIRGYKLSDNKRTLTVRDEISLKKQSTMHWFMHTKGAVTVVDNRTAVIAQNGKRLVMKFLTNAPSSTLSIAEAKPLPTSPQFENTENTGVSKIDFLVNGSGNVNITVKMALEGETGDDDIVDNSSISDWYENIYKNEFNLYINGVKSNTLKSGTIKGEYIMSPVLQNKEYRFIMAVYKNGILQNVLLDKKYAEDTATFSKAYELTDTENVTVKMMLWDNDMKYCKEVKEFK